MYISGAKFEEHCFNISRDILDWLLYYFSWKNYDVITSLISIMLKRKSKTKKDIPKRKKTVLLYFDKSFK